MVPVALGVFVFSLTVLLTLPRTPPVPERAVSKPLKKVDATPVTARRMAPESSSWRTNAESLRASIERDFPGRRFAWGEARPFLIAVERSPGVSVSSYETNLRLLHSLFRREIADPIGLPKADRVLPVVVLTGRWTGSASVPGLYEKKNRRVVLRHDEWALNETVFHEGAHLLLHAFDRPGASFPLWLDEGLGCWFETALNPDLPNHGRLARARENPMDLSELIRVRDTWSSLDEARRIYANSWGLVHYLMKEHREVFHRCLLDALQGRPVQLPLALEAVESGLRKHLSRMR